MKASYQVVYEGRNITADISDLILRISYTDKTLREADDLSITVIDDDHRWKNAWNPKKGDKIEVSITTDEGTLPCGVFDVDTCSFSGDNESGHICTIRGLSAGVKTTVRTKTSFAHEGKTLAAVVKKVADKYNYKVQGIIKNFKLERVTQFHETDLAFLQRLATEYGYTFSLRGDTFVFTYLKELAAVESVGTIDFNEIIGGYSIEDKVAGIYVRGQYRYHKAKEKRLIERVVEDGTGASSSDTLAIREHVDSDEEGMYKVQGQIYKKNMDQVELGCTLPGNIYIVAGNCVAAVNWGGAYDGKYFISESTHIIERDGSYTTSARYKRVLPATGAEVGTKKKTNIVESGVSIKKEASSVRLNLDNLARAILGNYATATLIRLSDYNINTDAQLIAAKGRKDVANDLTTKWAAIKKKMDNNKQLEAADDMQLLYYEFDQYLY